MRLKTSCDCVREGEGCGGRTSRHEHDKNKDMSRTPTLLYTQHNTPAAGSRQDMRQTSHPQHESGSRIQISVCASLCACMCVCVCACLCPIGFCGSPGR